MDHNAVKRILRSQKGMTLVELLVCCLIMSIIAAGILALVTANAKVARRVSNKVDSISEARIMLGRLGKDMRMGRTIGEVYALLGNLDAKTFPSTNDPLWGIQGTPAGWTGLGWKPTLSTTCMIIQIPVFDSYNSTDNGGYPLALPAGNRGPNGGAALLTAVDDVETHVYRVIADDQNPGEYKMELWVFPGRDSLGNYGAVDGPQTVLKHIVGPTRAGCSGTDGLCIFQVVDKTNPNGAPLDPGSNAVTSAGIANYTGLVINLELNNHDANGAGVTRDESRLAFKTEIFMRNNVLATTTSP